MIYIFNGCKNSCRACGKVCDHTCGPCLRVLDRPLGWYVAFCGIMNVLVVAFAALAYTDPSLAECSSPVSAFVMVDAALAVINIVFAFHAQNRLIQGMSDADASQMSSRDIMDRGWRIIVYDAGFCLYFFVFWACLIWNILGAGWVGECHSLDSGWASLCATLQIMFVFVTIGLLFMYWFFLSCDDCCGGSSRKQPPAQGQAHQGIMMRMLLGSPNPRGGKQAPLGKAEHGQPVVQGQPIQYGQAAPQTAPTAGGYYAQPSAPPQQQQQQQQQQAKTPAQQAMNVGAAVAGAGLNTLGGLLQGAGKKIQVQQQGHKSTAGP